MNYLSHYYMNKDNDSPYFKLGNIMPDLLRGFNATMRKPINNYTHTKATEIQVLQGIQRHYLEDRIFHNLPAFAYYNRLIKELIHTHTQIRHRTFYLSHIYVELLMDRLLMAQNPDLIDAFYQDLHQIELPVVESYFNSLQQSHIGQDFFGNFNMFRKQQFLRAYVHKESFATVLLRVFNRATREEFTEQDAAGIVTVTQILEAEHRKGFLAIFSTLKEHL